MARPGRDHPTLAEVLDAFPEVPILIEIKEPDPEFVETVIAAVDAAGARERVMISSFHDPVVHKVRSWPRTSPPARRRKWCAWS